MIPVIDAKGTGRKIRSRMETAGMGAKDIQKVIGCSIQAIYKWFDGTNIPTIDNLVILAEILDCKVDDLLEVNGDLVFVR